MILAAHQPNFLPWLGFFDRVQKADLFMLVDHIQFERQNYQNRTMINTHQGVQWITVPVFQRSQSERIIDKTIDERNGRARWGRRIYRTLEYCYGRAPYFREYAPTLYEIFDARWEKLVDLNITLLQFCLEVLEIRTPLIRSSGLNITGQKSDMVLNLCRSVGADTYIAGLGGSRGYIDADAFSKAGVQVAWQEFTHPTYTQYPLTARFNKGLSVLDLLFACGPESRKVLRQAGGLAADAEAARPEIAIEGAGARASRAPETETAPAPAASGE
jgi:hypothetical protein